MRAINRLRLDGGIPPRVVEDHVAGGGEVEAEAGGFQREEENGFGFVALKFFDEFSAILRLAGQHEVADAGGD